VAAIGAHVSVYQKTDPLGGLEKQAFPVSGRFHLSAAGLLWRRVLAREIERLHGTKTAEARLHGHFQCAGPRQTAVRKSAATLRTSLWVPFERPFKVQL